MRHTDTATLWRATSNRDRYGHVIFVRPTQIKVRWEQKHELVIDPMGQQVNLKAKVFMQIKIKVGDYLMLGASNRGTPRSQNNQENLGKVLRTESVKNLSGTKELLVVWV